MWTVGKGGKERRSGWRERWVVGEKGRGGRGRETWLTGEEGWLVGVKVG